MTHYTAADLAMAERHIVEGEAHIAGQELRITRLGARGRPTEDAEKLLRLFNQTQVEHRSHRDAIALALEQAGLPSGGSRQR